MPGRFRSALLWTGISKSWGEDKRGAGITPSNGTALSQWEMISPSKATWGLNLHAIAQLQSRVQVSHYQQKPSLCAQSPMSLFSLSSENTLISKGVKISGE